MFMTFIGDNVCCPLDAPQWKGALRDVTVCHHQSPTQI